MKKYNLKKKTYNNKMRKNTLSQNLHFNLIKLNILKQTSTKLLKINLINELIQD